MPTYSEIFMDANLKKIPIDEDIPSLFVMQIKRNRTPSSECIGYGLYLYFLGLSYRNTSKELSRFARRSHVAILKWIQRYKPKKTMREREKKEFSSISSMILL